MSKPNLVSATDDQGNVYALKVGQDKDQNVFHTMYKRADGKIVRLSVYFSVRDN